MKQKFDVYKIRVLKKQAHQRLDRFLGQMEWVKNRSQALHLIKEKQVTLKNRVLKASYLIKTGDQIQIRVLREEEGVKPFEFPIEIVHEDHSILVVNKPAGMVVHPAPGHKEGTLVQALFHKTLSPGSTPLRPGLVHRLDKEVSGLLVLAKNKSSEKFLIQQFKERKVDRIYKALCFSEPRDREGTIKSFMARHPVHRKKFVSLKIHRAGAKKACTHYKVLKSKGGSISLIECSLETGRTHQIRVHLSDLSCPLVGDKVYGKNRPSHRLKSKEILPTLKKLNRIALHAETLRFIHPQTKEEMFFKKSWPADMEDLLKKLQFF